MARPAVTGYFPRGESILGRVHGARIVGVTYEVVARSEARALREAA